ncbi:putative amidoligase domain-containing protein [Paenibacillus daejeonensis]|uniref:putative amidoligase domain-containing protein n=1 Tax=Paenibacillus daejeonensis TaxID=135193 RepID=UPI000371E03C|nr:hypothetical protein [Paenibacillus daejeonensis]
MAGSVWIWMEGGWKRLNRVSASIAGGQADIGPASGDAGFVMPGGRMGDSRRGQRNPDRPPIASHTSGGRASRPADFWLLRGAAQLAEEEPSSRAVAGKQRTTPSRDGELPPVIRERLTQAGLFVWNPETPLWSLREYAVPVFHLEALAVERVYRSSDRRSKLKDQEEEGLHAEHDRVIQSTRSSRSEVSEEGGLSSLARDPQERGAGGKVTPRTSESRIHSPQRRASLPTGFHIDLDGTGAAGREAGRNSSSQQRMSPEALDSPERIDGPDVLLNQSRDPLVRRAAKTAVRALYALGLDYGEIRVVLDGEGRAAVRTIMPMPPHRLDSPVGKAALQRFVDGYAIARETGGRERLQIGADPEFVLLRSDGRIVSPTRFLEPHGAAGCDTVVVGRTVRHPVAELRPDPASNPAELATHVRRLLQQAAAKITERDLRWLAGGMPVPGLGLGGHIHFSGTWLSNRLLRMLDSCVAFPLALVEDPAGRKRRPRYGMLGDYRLQPHGFEYRTPPSWLVSPMAAQAAFALGMLSVRELWTLSAAYGTLPAEQPELVAAYYEGDRELLHEGMRSFLELITRTDAYSELGRFISPLLSAIRSGATWDEQADLRRKWKLPTGVDHEAISRR